MNPRVAAVLEEIECGDKYKALECLCPDETWDLLMHLVSTFNAHELEIIHDKLCKKGCAPKGPSGGTTVSVTPQTPPAVEPAGCRVGKPPTGQRR